MDLGSVNSRALAARNCWGSGSHATVPSLWTGGFAKNYERENLARGPHSVSRAYLNHAARRTRRACQRSHLLCGGAAL